MLNIISFVRLLNLYLGVETYNISIYNILATDRVSCIKLFSFTQM